MSLLMVDDKSRLQISLHCARRHLQQAAPLQLSIVPNLNMPEVSKSSESQFGDRLKSTLWYHVGKIVDEETINLGVNATPQYIGSLTELVWAQIGQSPLRLISVES